MVYGRVTFSERLVAGTGVFAPLIPGRIGVVVSNEEGPTKSAAEEGLGGDVEGIGLKRDGGSRREAHTRE